MPIKFFRLINPSRGNLLFARLRRILRYHIEEFRKRRNARAEFEEFKVYQSMSNIFLTEIMKPKQFFFFLRKKQIQLHCKRV